MSLVRAVVDQVERSGHSAEALLQEAGLDASMLGDPAARLDMARYDRLQEHAVELTGDDALGLHMGEHASMAAFHVLGTLTAQCRTLREATEILLRYYRIVSDTRQPRLIEDGERAQLIYEFARSTPLCNRLRAEFGITRLSQFIHLFLGNESEFGAAEAWFEHARPAYGEEYDRIFRGRARFDMPYTGLLGPRAWLDREQRYADSQIFQLLKRHADEMLHNVAPGESHSERVHALILHHFHEVQPDMDAIARRLGLSSRSLRRRLAEEGVTFADVSSRAMGELARNVLREPATTIQEAAFRLGFAEVTSFHRAFKRWTGMTPKEFLSSG